MLALFAMAGFPAKANASSPDPSRSDLSSLPEIEAYLGSIGVDIGTVVVQQGRLNYAGPNCPGADWNCTTASMVVQLGPPMVPATNVVDCTPAVSVTLLGLNECLIVQSSVLAAIESTNSASCTMSASDGAKQKCKVKQSSRRGNNYAEVRATTKQWGGSPQTATQEADIEQTSDTGHNSAKITQSIEQTLGEDPPVPVTQEQQARQAATVNQTATSSGSNSSWVAQYLSQEENACGGDAITQKQNAATPPNQPNQEANVTQKTGTGNNTSNLSQKLNQHQSAASEPGPITQTQGTYANSGQKGRVLQTVTTPLTGVNRSTPNQDEDQKQDYWTTGVVTQTQIGPQDCCSTQVGGTADNVNQVVERNTQQNATGLASQSGVQVGHCTESGTPGANCSLDQTYIQNGNIGHFALTAPAVSHTQFCSGVNTGNPCVTD